MRISYESRYIQRQIGWNIEDVEYTGIRRYVLHMFHLSVFTSQKYAGLMMAGDIYCMTEFVAVNVLCYMHVK